MPHPKWNTGADEETLPDTSLRVYKDSRKDDIKGDSDKLASGDPKDLRASELEADDEEGGATPKH